MKQPLAIFKMIDFFKKNKLGIAVVLAAVLTVIFYFDAGLSLGLGVVLLLSGCTFFVLYKLGFKDKKIYGLFLIVLAIHLGTTLFMYYDNFQPFSGGIGDYLIYQKSAVEISQSFRQGDFSLKSIALKYPDLYTAHYYPVVVGALYALTMPKEIIGLMLNVWLVALAIMFVYLIVLEIGGSQKSAFLVGLIVAIYPSYIFNTGLLLKDAIEICFTILALLFLIRTVKKLTWYDFLVLYAALICVTHFRFYIGYALIATFVFCWFLFANMDFKKRAIYGVIFILMLGFIPQIAYQQGYYGINSVKAYLNFTTVTFYRQVAYNPAYYQKLVAAKPVATAANPISMLGLDSSFQAGSGMFGYVKSFVYVVLGPFPWQIKNLRQSLALIETIPWYLLLFFVADGISIVYKNRIKEAVPLLIFSLVVILLIAVFDNNFGLIVRIRIPAFISLACVASFAFDKNNYVKKLYEKIFS